MQKSTEESVAAVLWNTFRRYRAREQQLPTTTDNNNDTTTTTTPKEDRCTICLENLSSNKTESFPCQHIFHRICLEEWFKIERTCPMCRKILLFDDEYPNLM